ncbi:MAG: UvrD-helicase domain-containing protein [Deltaproteobacteria bacterium]|jgi:DNA helicase IV|nr:UvrD-helicase domain-containing protein [Deltaproteobacteria bacterium]
MKNFKMLSAEIQTLINEEVAAFDEVMTSLLNQRGKLYARLQVANHNTAELQNEIATILKEEDKIQYSSDESVNKSLNKKFQKDLVILNKILKNPYFARIIVEENLPNGKTKQIEYKMGQFGNPDCSIVDWKHGPIAKLYYEYQEGEEYCEEIQGREREGTVILRNKIEIKDGKLAKISCHYGTFVFENNEWQEYRRKIGENGPNGLPNILSLITPEQFKLITEDADSAVLIDGIAGSGKTTIALHRLAWLMEKGNKGIEANKSIVFVHNKIIKTYIKDYLPSIGAENPNITTFMEWKEKRLKAIVFGDKDYIIQRPSGALPPGVRRVKSSMAMLRAIDVYVANNKLTTNFKDDILNILQDQETLLGYDDTKLLNRETIQNVLEYTKKNFENDILDYFDDSIALRLIQLKTGSIVPQLGAEGRDNYYHHIVVDEVQDYSALNLAIIISSVKKTSDLTLVGDIKQQSNVENVFPGWDKLMEYWKFAPTDSRYAKLSVSHRSTFPIMRLADYVSGNQRTTSGRNGKKPLWVKCIDENDGIGQLLKWLNRGLEKYPTSIIAIICNKPQDAYYAESLLSPTFGSAVRLFSDNFFSFEEGIIVSTANNVKGLEFPIVSLWNPSLKHYPENKNSQHALYIAITRAQDILSIFSWGNPCVFMPSLNSKLIYGIDRRELLRENKDK